MKNIYLYLAALFFVLFTGLAFTGCKDDQEEGIDEGLSVKVYSPTKVMEGQEVVITGTGLNEVTAVVFPGNISVTSIKRTSHNMISVITPAGISLEGGELVVQTGNESVTARVPMTIGSPKVSGTNPSDKVGSGDELIIVGTDLEFIEKIIFPGQEEDDDVIINAVDFNRKSTASLRILVPKGIQGGTDQIIRLVDISGKVMSLPGMELIAGPSGEWTWVEYTAWTGEFDLKGWGNNWSVEAAWFKDMTPKKEDGPVSAVEGDIVKFYFDVQTVGGWPQFKFNGGNWESIFISDQLKEGNIFEARNVFPADQAQCYYEMPVLEGEILSYVSGSRGANAFVINGEGTVFTKIAVLKWEWVEIVPEKPDDRTLLWEGTLGPIDWNGEMKILFENDALSQLQVGKTMQIVIDCTTPNGWHDMRIMDAGWGWLPTPAALEGMAEGGKESIQFQPTDTSYEFPLAQADIDQIKNSKGLLFGGAAIIIKAIYLK